MVIQLDGASLLKRILCLVLIAIILVMSIGLPYAQAVAAEIAVVAGAKELICAVLIACGFEFARNEDARSVAGKVWDWLGEHGKSAFDAIYKSAQILVATQPRAGVGIRLSTDVFGALRDALVSFGFDPAVSGNQTISFFPQSSMTIDFSNLSSDALAFLSAFTVDNAISQISIDGNVYSLIPDGHGCDIYRGNDRLDSWGNALTYKDSVWHTPFFYWYDNRLWPACLFDSEIHNVQNKISRVKLNLFYDLSGVHEIASATDITVSGAFIYTGDQTMVLAPPMPGVTTSEDGKEVVVYPPMSLNPGDHKKEIPLPPSGLVDDIPYDVPIDATTGEVIDTQNPDISGGEDANIFQRFWDWIKGLLQSILDAIKAIASAIVGFLIVLLISVSILTVSKI